MALLFERYEVPYELVREICSYLSPRDFLTLRLACRKAHEALEDAALWSRIVQSFWPDIQYAIIVLRSILYTISCERVCPRGLPSSLFSSSTTFVRLDESHRALLSTFLFQSRAIDDCHIMDLHCHFILHLSFALIGIQSTCFLDLDIPDLFSQ